jgi:membrane associated rhomboid family serine protease
VFVPISDDNSQRLRVPFVNSALIVFNALAFLIELTANSHGQGALDAFVRHWAAVPADYTGHGGGSGGPVPLTLLTSMFLHGGWAHLIGNMIYLGIFGDNVESSLGHAKYLLFYLACGIVGALAHIFTAPASTVPTLGASAAISGVLAAYIVYFPANRVLVWFAFRVMAVPAMVVIGTWALMQFVSSAGSILSPSEGGGVAYTAHVGGFIAGLVLGAMFRPRGEARVA